MDIVIRVYGIANSMNLNLEFLLIKQGRNHPLMRKHQSRSNIYMNKQNNLWVWSILPHNMFVLRILTWAIDHF